MSLLTTILGLLTGLVTTIGSWLSYKSKKDDIETGKQIQQATDLIANKDIERQQSQILVNDTSKQDVVDKMKKGTF